MEHVKDKWPQTLSLVKIRDIVIGVGVRLLTTTPATIDEVYLNTLVPNVATGKDKQAKQNRRDEQKKYSDSVAAAQEIVRRWNLHTTLLQTCSSLIDVVNKLNYGAANAVVNTFLDSEYGAMLKKELEKGVQDDTEGKRV